MNKELQDFITELKRLNITVDDRTASHLLAFCEQKEHNRLVRDGRRSGQCEICGGEMR